MNDGWDALAAELRDVFDSIPHGPAVPDPDTSDLEHALTGRYRFDQPVPLETAMADVSSWLRRWTVHTTHPRYFGLFNPSVHRASIVADALAAAFNPQVGLWSHSPAANRIEQWTLRYLTRSLGWDPDTASMHFTSGGSEANLTAVAAAVTHAYPEVERGGLRALPGDPVFYVSAGAHHSFEKNAHVLGLGRDAARTVATDADHRLDPVALRAAIHEDRQAGRCPFLVVGTAGTTTLGVVDPLAAVARVCREESVWFHCDAAWGGGAVLSNRLRTHLAGIEMADSVTWDAHKWLSVSMGAGMVFTRHPDAVRRTFAVDAPYVRQAIRGTQDTYDTSLQWSRRFIGLKVFLTLAELGAAGMETHIDHQAAMGDLLRRRLTDAGWRVVGHTPFPLVCFTRAEIERGEVTTSALLERLYRGRDAWVSEAVLDDGTPVLRACITSYRTRPGDLDRLLEQLERALTRS